MTLLGKATLAGTTRYQQKFQTSLDLNHFRKADEIIASSVGIGTYLGESDEQTDNLVTEAIIQSVKGGINLIDSAIIYRNSQGERSIRKAINRLIESNEVLRDELIICTKGGVLPCETSEDFHHFCQQYVDSNQSRITQEDVVVSEGKAYHCIHPDYIEEQISQSLENLGIETIDIYYIHNPEMLLDEIDNTTFYYRLKLAFKALENAIASGKIGAYGVATWNGLRVSESSRRYLDLSKIKSIAREASGDKQDGFRYVQFPFNMGMLETLLTPTQDIQGKKVPLMEASEKLGLFSIASASLYQSKVIGKIPENIVSAFGEKFETDCQCALQYVRSTPGVLTALVGMKNPKHVEENLSINAYAPSDKQTFQEVTDLIVKIT